MKNTDHMQRKAAEGQPYVSPVMEVTEVRVEGGYQTSSPDPYEPEEF